MSEEAIIYKVSDRIATITMNRPKSLNSMSLDLGEGFIRSLQEAETDSQVRVVVVTGSGRAFSAGGDLKTLDGLHTTE